MAYTGCELGIELSADVVEGVQLERKLYVASAIRRMQPVKELVDAGKSTNEMKDIPLLDVYGCERTYRSAVANVAVCVVASANTEGSVLPVLDHVLDVEASVRLAAFQDQLLQEGLELDPDSLDLQPTDVSPVFQAGTYDPAELSTLFLARSLPTEREAIEASIAG